AVLLDLPFDDRLGELAEDRELVAEVLVQRLEVGGKLDRGSPVAAGGDVAVVDVHHVGALDEGVAQRLVERIERMVDLERAAGLRECSADVHVAAEVAGVSVADGTSEVATVSGS